MDETIQSTDLRKFAITFFTCFGAEVYEGEDDVTVILPPELIEEFKKPRLYLTFADENAHIERNLSRTGDLVVYGSNVFDKMIEILEEHGTSAYLQLTEKCSTDYNLTLPFLTKRQSYNVAEISFQKIEKRFFAFHFRVSYIWIEKKETLLTIILDEDGAPHLDKEHLLGTGTPYPIPDYQIDVSVESWENLYNQATTIAKKEVETQADILEQEIQSKLQKILHRLHIFYQRLSEESLLKNDTAKAQVVQTDIQEDLERKQAEEIERHQLHITIKPTGYALFIEPFGQHYFNVTIDEQLRRLKLQRSLHTGYIETFHCLTCLSELKICKEQFVDKCYSEECPSDCPLRQTQNIHSCLAMISETVSPSIIPPVVEAHPERYQWWQCEDSKTVMYLAHRNSPKFAEVFGERLAIVLNKENKVVERYKLGFFHRLREIMNF